MGSALGTLATSFYFVLWFEMNTILTMLALALLLMSAIALTAGNLSSRDRNETAGQTSNW